jgi:hypothetical protein
VRCCLRRKLIHQRPDSDADTKSEAQAEDRENRTQLAIDAGARTKEAVSFQCGLVARFIVSCLLFSFAFSYLDSLGLGDLWVEN